MEKANLIVAFCIGFVVAFVFFTKSDYDKMLKQNKELVLKGCRLGTTMTKQSCEERKDTNYMHTLNDNEPHKLWHSK